MIRNIILFSLALCCATTAQAQVISLLAHYSFDDCTAKDLTGNTNGTLVGNPACDCGISGQALVLDGIDDFVQFNGIVNGVFTNLSFTISFYFKPFDAFKEQVLLSTREDCTSNSAFFNISYFLSVGSIITDFYSPSQQSAQIATLLDPTCWHHCVITRNGNRIYVYINGRLVDERLTNTTVTLTNNAPLLLGSSPCVGANVDRFRGKIDELRIYNQALSAEAIRNLYLSPDHIGNRDTILYLGNNVQTFLTPTCAASFNWTPTNGVSNPSIAAPVLAPTQTTTYQLSFLDSEGCTTTDSVTITVIDPADLDCDDVFLPKAFTPNGDNLNDYFVISNPQVLQQMENFSIYNRWGVKLFSTDNPFDAWDGTLNGIKQDAGVYVYLVEYVCDGQTYHKTGSVSLIR